MSTAHDIEQQAASWLLRRDEPGWTPDDQATFEAWLGESMAHKAAYWRLEHGWRSADRLVALGPAALSRDPRLAWTMPALPWRPMAVAASLLLLVAAALAVTSFGGYFAEPETRVAEARFATPLGGRRIVSLGDGSRAELNTSTVVRVAVDEDRREVWLDAGEAYFDVAHAPDRPFVVHAGPRRITVLGTRFSVRRDGPRVTVAVAEGRVRIDPGGPAATERSTTIAAGDMAIGEGAETLVAAGSARRIANNLSWRQGMLAFDGETLGDVAAEFNRYNRRQVVIADPEIAGMRIGGTFRAANVDAFIRLLRDAYGLRVEDQGGRVTISG